MKREKSLAQISRTALLLGLIFFAFFAAVRAQTSGTVIPTVCFETKPETFTRSLSGAINAGGNTFNVTESLPNGLYRIVVNPGGATEERLSYARSIGNTAFAISGNGFPSLSFSFSHAAGETVLLTADGDAVYGYNNLSNTTVTIPRGPSSDNYFVPGSLVYVQQTTNFQPGIHQNAFRLKAISNFSPITWFLNGGEAISLASAGQSCGTITYQGRLSDAGSAANGQFDLQFQIFDSEIAGAVKSELIRLENVQVTNGIFTVPLNFGSTLTGNYNARFLEIAVRPGASTSAFTVLAPRQPLTQVPFAVNATLAANATQLDGKSANSFLQNSTAPQTNTNFNITGNGTIGGNLTVAGTINGAVTNATNAMNAANADKLGNVAANQYLTASNASQGFIQNTATQQTANFNISGNGNVGGDLTVGGAFNANFGQNVCSVFGTEPLEINNTTNTYTLVPGLTQTVNVPANAALFISTDGGIQSQGADVSSYSVVDVAIFVDGNFVGGRRIVVANNPFPLSFGNWALSLGQTLSPGSHTIEVKAINGSSGSSPARISADNSNPLLKGQLTVTVIRK